MAKILIVDDSRTSRKILRTLLEAEGHEIIMEATNGEEGVNYFKQSSPDIVTMDITMPIMDGIEATKRIMAENKDAKIIMVTAAGQQNKMMDAIRAGAKEFITKPFDKDIILAMIDKLTEK